MVVMLLICAGFQEDWMGYDRYLPEQGEIREASIVCSSYASKNIISDTSQILNGMRPIEGTLLPQTLFMCG